MPVGLWAGKRVLAEADEVFRRKASDLLPLLAGILDRANIQVGPPPTPDHLARVSAAVSYLPDAYILAEALAAGAEFFATDDRAHYLANPRLGELSFRAGSPGNVLGWLRDRIVP